MAKSTKSKEQKALEKEVKLKEKQNNIKHTITDKDLGLNPGLTGLVGTGDVVELPKALDLGEFIGKPFGKDTIVAISLKVINGKEYIQITTDKLADYLESPEVFFEIG